MNRNASHLFYFFIHHGQPWFFDIAEIVDSFFQRGHQRLDISLRSFQIEIPDMREGQHFLRRSVEKNDIRQEFFYVFHAHFVSLDKPVIVSQIFAVALLENIENFDQTVLNNFAPVIVLIHVFNEFFHPLSEERRDRLDVHALQIFMRLGIVAGLLSLLFPIRFMERIDASLGVGRTPGMRLNSLLQTYDSAFRHELWNPRNGRILRHIERKSLMNRNTVLNHLVEAGVLSPVNGFDKFNHRMIVAAVIFRRFCFVHNFNEQQSNGAGLLVQHSLRDLRAFRFQDGGCNLFQFIREDAVNEVLSIQSYFAFSRSVYFSA